MSIFVIGDEIGFGRTGAALVFSEVGETVRLGSFEEDRLSGLHVLWLSLPGLED